MTDPTHLLAGLIHGSTCEDSPPECIEFRGTCVKGGEAVAAVLEDWTIALHSDGSGQPGLYHGCDPEQAIDWLEADSLGSVLVTVFEHSCEVSR